MAEYARMRGCSKAAVTKACKRKQIHLVDGLVDPIDADQTWPKNAPHGPAAEPKAPPRGARPPATSNGNGNGSQPADLDYWKVRADHEWQKARLAELELAQQEGRLLDAEEVKRELFDSYRLVRESLQTIPARMCGVLAGEKDEDRIHRLLSDAIDEALIQLHARFRAD